MPHAITSASNSCHGSEEGIGHPDGEDGVLLSDGLSGSNVITRRATYAASYGELCPTADEGDEGYATGTLLWKIECVVTAMAMVSATVQR